MGEAKLGRRELLELFCNQFQINLRMRALLTDQAAAPDDGAPQVRPNAISQPTGSLDGPQYIGEGDGQALRSGGRAAFCGFHSSCCPDQSVAEFVKFGH
jgi:hypothetical protein